MYVYPCSLSSFFFFFVHFLQGDVKFAEVLEKMGAKLTWESNAMTVSRDEGAPLRGVDVDCGEIPDAAMTLAVSLRVAESVCRRIFASAAVLMIPQDSAVRYCTVLCYRTVLLLYCVFVEEVFLTCWGSRVL